MFDVRHSQQGRDERHITRSRYLDPKTNTHFCSKILANSIEILSETLHDHSYHTGCLKPFQYHILHGYRPCGQGNRYTVGLLLVMGRRHRCPPESVAVIAAGMTDLIWGVHFLNLRQSNEGRRRRNFARSSTIACDRVSGSG